MNLLALHEHQETFRKLNTEKASLQEKIDEINETKRKLCYVALKEIYGVSIGDTIEGKVSGVWQDVVVRGIHHGYTWGDNSSAEDLARKPWLIVTKFKKDGTPSLQDVSAYDNWRVK